MFNITTLSLSTHYDTSVKTKRSIRVLADGLVVVVCNVGDPDLQTSVP
jgi:hypothetical protein